LAVFWVSSLAVALKVAAWRIYECVSVQPWASPFSDRLLRFVVPKALLIDFQCFVFVALDLHEHAGVRESIAVASPIKQLLKRHANAKNQRWQNQRWNEARSPRAK